MPGGVKKIIDDLGLQKLDRFSSSRHGKKVFSKVVNNVPRQENRSIMIDLLSLPTTKRGFRYLLVAIDLWSNQVDFQPLKTKKPEETKAALQSIFRRKLVGPIEAPSQVSTDGGTEFQGSFKKWLSDRNIYHKVALPHRHQQQATVERMNRTIGRILNLWMSRREIETGETYREWDYLLPYLRTKLNDHRIRNLRGDQDVFNEEPPPLDPSKKPRFQVGDMVHRRLDHPEDVFGKKQPTATFRVGDMKYEREPREIVQVFPYPPPVNFRYQLEGLEQVSYPAWELMPSDLEEKMFRVKKLISRNQSRDGIYYLVWWEGEPKSSSTWEPRSNLVIDPVLRKAVEFFDREHPLSKHARERNSEENTTLRRSERLRPKK